MTRYSVYRRDPQDPEGNGCINERTVGLDGYAAWNAAEARADHAAQGEYGRTRIWVERTDRDGDRDTVYSRFGAIDPPTRMCDFDGSHLADTDIACPACYIPGANKGD